MGNITIEDAKKVYEKYMEEGLKMFPPFKGYGMKYLQFAREEPEMYRMICSPSERMSYTDYIFNLFEADRVIPYIQSSLDLNREDSEWLFKNMLIYVHGMVSLLSSGCIMTPEEINTNLGAVCRGLMMQIKAPSDERIRLIPGAYSKTPEELQEYIKGKKNVIIGYGQEREIYQIRLDAILYFEAVSEKVFAYTKQNVYEIKQRLYQLEDFTKGQHFVRAAKSLLINIKKIESIASATGGRGKINLINGETVIASRAYYKDIMDKIKNPND